MLVSVLNMTITGGEAQHKQKYVQYNSETQMLCNWYNISRQATCHSDQKALQAQSCHAFCATLCAGLCDLWSFPEFSIAVHDSPHSKSGCELQVPLHQLS